MQILQEISDIEVLPYGGSTAVTIRYDVRHDGAAGSLLKISQSRSKLGLRQFSPLFPTLPPSLAAAVVCAQSLWNVGSTSRAAE